MVEQAQVALADAAEWLGDWHPLAEQLGSTEGLVSLGAVSSLLRLPPVRDVGSLHRFLRDYQQQVLFPIEFTAIHAAYRHAERGALRELVGLDQELSRQPILQNFAGPSCRIGRGQLQKLKPLRDNRMVQRYLCAVDSGAARGWHTLVYGLTLEVYSLPLRQGLIGYAHQTTRGFIYAAARMLRLSERGCRELYDRLAAAFPAAVEELLQQRAAA